MLVRTCVSAKRGRLHCWESAKVSPAPQAYQKSSVVKPPLPISTKEIQKTFPPSDHGSWWMFIMQKRLFVWSHKIHRNGGEKDGLVPQKTEGATFNSPIQNCKNPKNHFQKFLHSADQVTPIILPFSFSAVALSAVHETNLLRLPNPGEPYLSIDP